MIKVGHEKQERSFRVFDHFSEGRFYIAYFGLLNSIRELNFNQIPRNKNDLLVSGGIRLVLGNFS